MDVSSPNFSFLETHDPQFVRVAASAESHCLDDPVAALTKIRILAEMLAGEAAARVGIDDTEMSQFERLRALEEEGVLPEQTANLFHSIRRKGNDAVHEHEGTASDALGHLKLARQVAVWFHRTFDLTVDDSFHPGSFVPPPDQDGVDENLEEELNRLRNRLAEVNEEVSDLREMTAEERERRRRAEEEAEALYEEIEVYEELLDEAAEETEQFRRHLTEVRTEAQEQPASRVQDFAQRAERASSKLDLDEDDTRRLIDEQLREAGWEADSQELRYSQGARPQKGVDQAIAEWPTETGPADYVLFLGLTPVAVVEAKKWENDVSGAIDQAQRYANGLILDGDAELADDAPWDDDGPYDPYRVPFVFASNGRPYLKQIKTKSGVWFRDVRRPTNTRAAIMGFYSPGGIRKRLAQDVAEAERKLEEKPVDLPGLRYYQKEAINALEDVILDGEREALLAMATGTGKTRTALGLIYRLVKFGRFHRILFLVDRTTLGDQAMDTFRDVNVESTHALADVYDVKDLDDLHPESDTRVHIATVQGMVRRIINRREDEDPIPVDRYDCIIVDECHRGYNLDQELSDAEMEFRSLDDYVSKYRRVIEYFDAVRIGMTATPALHTTEIFGDPVYEYGYRQAVVDGYLVDHEPPLQITTALSEDGIHWDAGDELLRYDPRTSTVDLIHTPDEIDVDIDSFNSKVVTREFNEAVIGRIVQEIDPSLPGKTLVFCVDDDHADLVVDVFKEKLEAVYGEVRDDTVKKITGYADEPQQLIRYYKNEQFPRIAVTVDLLTTGVDVPAITDLVFLRRVKSRILYEQMIGRATRLCDGLYRPNQDKESFRIFDAVQLYDALQDYSDMKPVVQQPNVSFSQLASELRELEEEEHRGEVFDQFMAKLNRKKSALKQNAEDVETRTGHEPESLFDQFRSGGPDALQAFLDEDPEFAAFLDDLRYESPQHKLISQEPDQVREVKRGYGTENVRPEPYLKGLRNWIDHNRNELTALEVVLQRPRDLTREQLKKLHIELSRAGYTETQIREAIHETSNQDIAASIIGFLRSQALGSPLVPYEERVERALRSVLREHEWTSVQERWLKRIAKQIQQNVVVDREAFDEPPFDQKGGYDRLNKIFDGQLGGVLNELQEEVWDDRTEAA
jgi:type I restriction enzyme R subunit